MSWLIDIYLFPQLILTNIVNNSIATRNHHLVPFGGLAMTPWRDVAYTLGLPAPSNSALALSSPDEAFPQPCKL
jgi:hypothetical protein